MKNFILSFIFLFFFYSFTFADTSIEGVVKFKGTAPHARLIHMDADPICYTINKGNTKNASIALGQDNALADVFVFIKSGLPKTSYPIPNGPRVINQAGCNYEPHILGVMKGQKVKFLNPDGTLHNVHAMCQVNPEFNASMPDFRHEIDVVFNQPEFMFPIRCDVHPWMQAWMAVMDHPFFAVTGLDGKFQIKGMPEGKYIIEAWHDKLPAQDSVVVVKNGVIQKTDFTFTLADQ